MKNKIMKLSYSAIMQLSVIFIVLNACQSGGNKKVANLAPNAHQVEAVEVIQAGGYTYVRAVEDKKDYWLAINSMDVKEGSTYFWSKGMEMNNFTSKELKRTFPSILFIEDFTDKPILAGAGVPGTNLQASSMAGKPHPPQKPGITVTKAEGGLTIAELYAQKSAYEGKSVKVKGEVVHFASQIMNKNWVHLQDGTKDGDNWDLTITTKDSVTTGDVVTFEGVISLNKDFGHGYVYDLIMEDAKILKKL
jgi:hypothetical protein